ncbi:hypothetical protein MNEG_14590 [Monoraphidium neglectum]|uniref:Uncharacterized protein n=1 Tax=Monoraphidium neglectum TaxID=145388 RepID=A0A0D2KBU8_9CHLO|nr:hypothetical protein MNEG_14590 [Monoraphidium neglectum]KIY93373.1 hypothetical protein MNEG_14590 [Monoraphidium neglectum]|eukprot:XP_013892393.1 hypothetical protein MNEG_14590 [Monoraphidium neglectum]
MLTRAVVLLLQGKKALAKMQAGDYDEAAVRTRLENLITTRPVVVFSFSTCPFCVKVRRRVGRRGVLAGV